MNQQAIYLDFNASTPLAPEVAKALEQVLQSRSGIHPVITGPDSLDEKQSRWREVRLPVSWHASQGEIVFTSGGSESNNHALKGVFYAHGRNGAHIITWQVEHPAIINPRRFLERLGAEVTYLPVDGFGRIDPDDVRHAITTRTMLISSMHANNEVGTIEPITDIARIAREHILFHTDAAQSVGKIRTRIDELGVDLLSIAGHKLYGPKGVGHCMCATEFNWNTSFTVLAMNLDGAPAPRISCSTLDSVRLVRLRKVG